MSDVQTFEWEGLTIHAYRGSDGVRVLDIDSEPNAPAEDTLTDDVPKLRIYVNYDIVHESAPLSC